ncbi:MAG: hypothetical protein GXX90_08405 [Microbacteriaceae bacterium]|nr:hypothetical protein [Microbacteriaceae bacterium]
MSDPTNPSDDGRRSPQYDGQPQYGGPPQGAADGDQWQQSGQSWPPPQGGQQWSQPQAEQQWPQSQGDQSWQQPQGEQSWQQPQSDQQWQQQSSDQQWAAGGYGSAAPTRTEGGGRGLALTALILGVAAIVVALLPILILPAIIVWPIALAGLVVAIIALVKRQPKGLSITGLVLSVLAPGIAMIMAIVWPFVLYSGEIEVRDDAPPVVEQTDGAGATDAAEQTDPVEPTDDMQADAAVFPSFDMPTDLQPLGTEQDNGRGLRVTALEARYADEWQGMPLLHDRYLVVKVRVENYGAEDHELSVYEWEAFQDAEVAFDSTTYEITGGNADAFPDGEAVIKAGETVEFEIPYDLLETSTPVLFAHGPFVGDGDVIGWSLDL